MKTRHKILLVLMAALTVIMVVIQSGVVYCYHHPPIPKLTSSISLTGILFLNTIFYFLPAYLGVWLLWAIGVKIALWLKYRDR